MLDKMTQKDKPLKEKIDLSKNFHWKTKVVDVIDLKQALKKVDKQLDDDTNFIKEVGFEPNIHIRRVKEIIKNIFGDFEDDDLDSREEVATEKSFTQLPDTNNSKEVCSVCKRLQEDCNKDWRRIMEIQRDNSKEGSYLKLGNVCECGHKIQRSNPWNKCDNCIIKQYVNRTYTFKNYKPKGDGR